MDARAIKYLEKLQLLAAGKSSPKDISEWAIQEELRIEAEPEIKVSEKAERLLESLQLAGALNEHGEQLYTTEDFRQWLQEE